MTKADLALLKADGLRILKGAIVATCGAGLTILTTQITAAFAGYDFGPILTPIIVAAWSIVANAVRVTFSRSTKGRR